MSDAFLRQAPVSQNDGALLAADRLYWVRGSGNWSDGMNHWAAASGGGPVNTLPGAGTDAIFDALSAFGAYTVAPDIAGATCRDLNFSAEPPVGVVTLSFNGNSAFTVAGNVNFLSDMVFGQPQATLLMTAPSGTKTITTNGKAYPGGLHINAGAGATIQLADNFTTSKTDALIKLSAGTFDPNGKTVTSNAQGTTHIQGAWTFFNFTRAGVSVVAANGIDFDSNVTFTGTLMITGSLPSCRVLCLSTAVGTPRTLTAAAVSITDADFQDITGAGVAAPFTGTRLGDCKGNSGITMTGAVPKFYVGNTNNWSASNAWALASGGAGAANNYPLPQDTATLDAGSFNANGQTLTIGNNERLPTLICSGTDQTYNINFNGGTGVFFGDVTLDANATISAGGQTTYSGRNVQTITSAGKQWDITVRIESLGGTWKPADDFTLSTATTNRTFTHVSGTVDFNGRRVTMGSYAGANVLAHTLKSSVAGGVLATTSTLAVGVISGGGGIIVDRTGDRWSVEIGGDTVNVRTFITGGFAWPATIFTNATPNGGLDFNQSATLKSLSVTAPPQTIRFTILQPVTFESTNGFPQGTDATHKVTIDSTTAATHNLILTGGGVSTVMSRDFLNVKNSAATPAGAWGAGHNSTDNGGNTGWNFGDAFLADKAETGAAADTALAGLTVTDSVTEASGAVDTVSATQTASATAAEVAAAVDAASAAQAANAVRAEAANAADAVSGVYTANATNAEAGGAVDTTSATQTANATLDEVGNAADTPSATASYNVAIVEDGAAIDSTDAGISYSVSVFEAGVPIDAIVSGSSFSADVAELANAIDSVSAIVSRYPVRVTTFFLTPDSPPVPPAPPDPYPVRVIESYPD